MAAVRIPVSSLKPGMFLVDPGASWLQEPLLYMREGRIADQEEINSIISQGFAEAVYDPDRALLNAESSAPSAGAPLLAEEMPFACEAYSNAYIQIQRCMESAEYECPDILVMEPCVISIIQSLKRNADAMLALANLKGKDEYTYRHSVNVAVLAIAFSRYLGLTEPQQRAAGLAGLFHDYGKALIPKEILNAPRTLFPEELSIMRSHVTLGYEKLRHFPNVLPEILEGVAQHHEMHNGSGYPNGLSGSQIGLFGRILSLCDVYDALASKRVYKDAIHPNHALGTMYKMGGSAWAHGYVEHFIKMTGIFPIGSAVRLSNGRCGVVCHTNPAYPALPGLLLIKDEKEAPRPDCRLDLWRQSGTTVMCSLPAEESECWNIPALLGIPRKP